MALRVLFVANTLPPADLSGAGEQVVQLAAGLTARGHEARLLGRGPGGVWGPKLLFPLLAPPRVWLEMRRFRPDVIQVHESDGALVGLLVRILRLRPGGRSPPAPRLCALLQVTYVEERRAVRVLRDPEGRELARPTAAELRFRYLRTPIQIAFGWLTAKLADLVLAPSQKTASEIEGHYGVSRVEVLPNVTGAPRNASAPSPSPPAEAREDGQLLFVGRLRIRKGIEVLLEAVSQLGRRGRRPEVIIAGDGERRRSVEQRCRELELSGQVRLLGRCRPEELRELLCRATALVVPSIYEGMPLVILEAMELGTPVVASRVSGIPEVVVDGLTGWLVEPEDPRHLSEVLEAVLESPAEAQRRGEAGRERLLQSYRPEHAAQRWCGLVEALDGG